MAPRIPGRVRIVSPGSGTITLSRSRGSSLQQRSNPNTSTNSHSQMGSKSLAGRSREVSLHSSSGGDGEDDGQAVVQRVVEGFNAASVLRRPGKRERSNLPPPSASGKPNEEKENRSRSHSFSGPVQLGKTTGGRRTRSNTLGKSRSADQGSALQLPRYIPQHRRVSTSTQSNATVLYEDDEDDDLRRMPLLRRKTGEDGTYTSTYYALQRQLQDPHRDTAPPPPTTTHTNTVDQQCPPMFKGLSALSLPENLFKPVDQLRIADLHPPRQNHNTNSTNNNNNNNNSNPCSVARRGALPLWCLVGTFKTSLDGVVLVDYAQEALHWTQRNPRGGFQSIRIPLPQIEQVFVTRVTQSDEEVEERQFMVVVKTSTRPSQVVFGFHSLGEANQFKKFFDGYKN